MSVKALITMLAVGASSVASAHPIDNHRSWNGGVRVERDHRFRGGFEGGFRADFNWGHHRYVPVPQPVPVVVPQPVPVQQYWDGYSYDPGYAYPNYSTLSLMSPAALVERIQLETGNKLAGMRTLRISEAGYGSTYISSVTLNYWNGVHQKVDLQRYVQAGSPIEIPIGDGANLGGVVVDGNSVNGGSIAVDAF
jgi:hypothetical protein